MPSDNELLERYVRDRSQEAFGELVRRHVDLVRRHVDLVYSSALRRVGMDTHLAEDVTQDVFLELARKSDSLLGRSALEGWLYTTGRFKAVDVVRKVSRRRIREALLMNANLATDTAVPEWEKLRPLIDEALDSLGKADGAILILRFFQNRSYTDLARSLALSEDAARMRSARALERLRKALAKRGIKSTAEALGVILASNAVAAAPLGMAARVSGGALALSQGSNSASASVLHAVNMSKIAMGIATLALLLASVATAVHEFHAQQRAADMLAREDRDNTSAEARLKDMVSHLKSALAEESRLKASVQATLAALELAKAKRSGASDIVAVGRDFVARNPSAQELITGHDMARNAQKYVALFNSLGLSPEKQAQFLRVLAARSDLGLTWYSAPDSGTPSAAISTGLDTLSQDEVETQLRGILGDDGYKSYQNFNKIGGAQDLAQMLAGSLFSTETPLTAVQENQLVQIMAQSSADYQSSKGIWSASQVGWDATLSNAQAILSGPQMDALRMLKQTSEYEQAINAAINQASGEAADSVTASLAAGTKAPK